MKWFILTFVLVMSMMFGKAQSVGFFVGHNLMYNSLFGEPQLSFVQTLPFNNNYSFGFEFDGMKISNFPLKLTVKYNTFSGKLFYNNSGNGGGYEVNINHKSQNLSLGLQYSKALKNNKLRYSFGLGYSYLIKEDFSGYTFQYDWVNGAIYGELSPNNSSLFSTHRIYVMGTVGYLFQFGENWFVLPQITLQSSLNKEVEYISSARSFIVLTELGMGRKIK